MKAKLFAIVTLALLAIPAFAAGDPDEALKAITTYQQEAYKEAQAAGTRPDTAVINAKIKEMATAAIEGVTPSSVEPEKAYSWAQLFLKAEKFGDIHELCSRFIETDPSEELSFSSHYMCLQAFQQLEQFQAGADTIFAMNIPNATNAYSVAYMAAGVFAPGIAKEQGMSAAKDLLDAVMAKLPEAGDGPNDARYLAFAKTQLIGGFATLISDSGDVERAIKYLDRQILLSDDEEVKKNLAGSKRSMSAEITRNALTGNAAPAFEFGKEIGGFKGLDAWKGKVVLLDFFAHWCGPCKASFPDVRKMYDDLKGEGLEIVSVTRYYNSFGAERDLTPEQEFAKMPGFMAEYDMNWQVAYIESGVFDEYGVTGIPTAYLIDRDGNVHSYKVGYSAASFAEFRLKVEELLKK